MAEQTPVFRPGTKMGEFLCSDIWFFFFSFFFLSQLGGQNRVESSDSCAHRAQQTGQLGIHTKRGGHKKRTQGHTVQLGVRAQISRLSGSHSCHQVSFVSRVPLSHSRQSCQSPPPTLVNPLFCLTKSQNAGLHPDELSSLKSLAGNLIDELASTHCGD